MVSQPLPAHWAEVTQQTPPFTAASPPVSSQGYTANEECEECDQSDGTKHAVT